MSDPISQDTREAFITGYFSIFLALGLGQFISTMITSDGTKQAYNLINIISFVSVYSWVVSYWIVYHRLTSISPYKNTAIFFFDVTSFTILLFILLISFRIADDFNRLAEFVLFFAIIHIIGGTLAYIMSIKQQQIKKMKLVKYSLLHFGWASVFLGTMAILFLFYQPQPTIKAIPPPALYYFVLGIIFIFIIIRFVIFRSGKIDQSLVLERRPVDKAGLDYNDSAKHYYTHSINKILREKHLCENGQKNKDDWYWYHIRVRNVHSTKPAINCIVHLEKWYRIIGYEKDDFKKVKDTIDYLYDVEFKWVGVSDKEVVIEPNEYRDFDGLCVYEHTCVTQNDMEVSTNKITIKVVLGINQRRVDNDNVRQAYLVKKPGDYELSFVIYSLNMRYEKESFILHVPDSNNIDKIIFHKKDILDKDTILTHKHREQQPLVCTRCHQLKQNAVLNDN
jgi:hypothetical protein